MTWQVVTLILGVICTVAIVMMVGQWLNAKYGVPQNDKTTGTSP